MRLNLLSFFPVQRERFLKAWIAQPDSLSLGAIRDGELAGFGVIRRCGNGCKIGPLFADDGEVADTLYTGLSTHAPGDPVFLDVPENNSAAMALAARHDMQNVFSCARMYLGPIPDIQHHKVFGVTTFELG